MNQHPEIIAAKFHKIIPVNLSIYCCRCQHLYNFMNAWIGFCNRRKSVDAWLIFKWIHSHWSDIALSDGADLSITSDQNWFNVWFMDNKCKHAGYCHHIAAFAFTFNAMHRIHSSTIKITSSSIEFHTFCSKSIDGAERDGATSQTLCPDRTR